MKNQKKAKRNAKSPKDFAAMSKAQVRRIAAMGGRASRGGGRPRKSKV
jgi:hypothetical protein